MTDQRESDSLSPQLPNLRFGFGIAILLFVLEIVWDTQKDLARGTPESQSAGGADLDGRDCFHGLRTTLHLHLPLYCERG